MTRSFSQVHQFRKAQPSVGDTHVETSVQRRRARSFSEVIAAVTRGGLDSDMNAFKPQKPEYVGDKAKPDWRGHYLGNDFNSVTFSERQRRTGNDYSTGTAIMTKDSIATDVAAIARREILKRSPLKKVKGFNAVVAKRRADRFAVDVNFHQEKDTSWAI